MTEESVAIDTKHYPDGLNANFHDEKAVEKYGGDKGVLEDVEKRDIARSADEVVAMLVAHAGLREGSTVVDVGAGTGLLLSRLDAVIGGQGRLIATEISDPFLNWLRSRVGTDLSLNSRLSIVKCSNKHCGIDPAQDGLVDVALLCDVYHHLEQPVTFCQSLRQALKPDGRMCVIDFHRDPSLVTSDEDPDWVLKHVRAGKDEFRAEIESAGFELVSEPSIPQLKENYVLMFKPKAAVDQNSSAK